MAAIPQSERDMIWEQSDSRLDEGLHFFFRLSKPDLLAGTYAVTDSGDCFHFRISLAAYPHNKIVAKEIVRKMLKPSVP